MRENDAKCIMFFGVFHNIYRNLDWGSTLSTADFYEQPAVINGFSDFIVDVFGERGKHARSAVGMVSLPSKIPVEVEVVVEVVR